RPVYSAIAACRLPADHSPDWPMVTLVFSGAGSCTATGDPLAPASVLDGAGAELAGAADDGAADDGAADGALVAAVPPHAVTSSVVASSVAPHERLRARRRASASCVDEVPVRWALCGPTVEPRRRRIQQHTSVDRQASAVRRSSSERYGIQTHTTR